MRSKFDHLSSIDLEELEVVLYKISFLPFAQFFVQGKKRKPLISMFNFTDSDPKSVTDSLDPSLYESWFVQDTWGTYLQPPTKGKMSLFCRMNCVLGLQYKTMKNEVEE